MLHCGRQQRIKCARLSTTKSQQIVGCRDIDFLLLESTRYADYLKAPTQRALARFMSERQESPYDSTARRWLALVERRQQNFIELWNTGRWQHYYTHAQFLDEMRKMLDLRNRWASLAGLPATEQIAIRHRSKQNEQQDRDGNELELRLRPHGRAATRPRPAAALLAAVPAQLSIAGLNAAKPLSRRIIACTIQNSATRA